MVRDGATSIQNNNQFNCFASDDSKYRDHPRYPPGKKVRIKLN